MFNRAKIMQAAWKMVRHAGNREALSVRLSRALRNAWADAKEEAAVARLMARQAAARVSRFAAMTVAQLRNAIDMTESVDRLGHAGMQSLTDLRRALAEATGKELIAA